MMQGYSSLQQKMNVFQRVIYKAQMLKEKPRMEMVYESGWLKLFDQYDTQDLPDTLWASMRSMFFRVVRNGAADGDDQSHRHNAAWTACHRAVQAVAFFYCMWLNNGAQPFAALLGLYP